MSHRGCPSPAWFALIWGGSCVLGASGTTSLLAWVARGKAVPDATSTRLPWGQQAGGGHAEPLMLPVWDPARAAMFCFMGWETAAHGMQTACYGAQGQDGLLGGTAGTGHAPKPAGGCSLGQRRLRPHVVIPRASPRLPPQTQHGAECWCELSAAANTFFAIFSPSAPCRWFQHYYFFNFPQ